LEDAQLSGLFGGQLIELRKSASKIWEKAVPENEYSDLIIYAPSVSLSIHGTGIAEK
jgi:hypothetical protein